MSSWQIALIAIGAALLAATAGVLVVGRRGPDHGPHLGLPVVPADEHLHELDRVEPVGLGPPLATVDLDAGRVDGAREGQDDLVLEVQQHMGHDRVRCVAMDAYLEFWAPSGRELRPIATTRKASRTLAARHSGRSAGSFS